MIDKRVYCNECKEETFRTREDRVSICQGCGTRAPRKLTKSKTLLFSELEDKDKEYVDNLAVYDKLPGGEPENAQFVEVSKRFHKLSSMEKNVLSLIMEGKTYAESALILGISEGEIGTYINRARIKLK